MRLSDVMMTQSRAVTIGIPIRRCSIVPTLRTSGHTKPAIPTGSIERHRMLLMWLAGPAAEKKFTGKASAVDEHDRQMAALAASVMADAEPDAPATTVLLKRFQIQVNALLVLHWPKVERVAKALLVRRELSPARTS